jgi:hypothetical protein
MQPARGLVDLIARDPALSGSQKVRKVQRAQRCACAYDEPILRITQDSKDFQISAGHDGHNDSLDAAKVAPLG